MTRTAEMTTATATTTTAAFKQYKFDSILVTQPNTTPKPVYPPQLSFDKKSIYAGDNANWKLNFKDLKEVQQSTIERDVYDNINNDGYGGRNGGGRGGRGGYATTSETLVLSLVGRKILLKCTTRKGHSAKAAHHLDSFLQGLKSAHRKVKVKNDGKDPYAFEEKKHAAAGSRGRSRSSLGQTRNKRSIQVTPAQQSLYLSPHKKRHSTSGAFTSPIRKRRTSSVDAAKKSSSKGYSHYDPAVEEEDVEVTGNVVLEPESPAARVLKLPPKSPRNATPTKLRRVDGMEENTKPMRALIVNQLNGISGGNIKLKKKVDERMFAELSEDEFEDDEKETEKQEEEAASQPEAAEEKKEEEDGPPLAEEEEKASDAPKRRRLQKARGSRKENSNNDDNDDSDMEFDSASSEANLSSCKKKLRMTLDDDDDDDEDEDEAKMSNEKEATNDDETTKSPSKPEPAEEPPKPKESTADAALSPKKKVAAPPKKGSIASFFAPKSSAAAKSSTTSAPDKKKEAEERSLSPARDTYGVAISTPLKKTPAKKPSSPSTPPRRTDSSKATPVPRQTQRKTSRYFANVDINGVATKKKKKNGTQTTLKYSSSEEEENNDEDVLPDYQDDYNDGYYNDENASNKGSNEKEDTYRTTAQERYPDTIRNRRPGGVYGRPKMPQGRLARRQHLAFSKLKQEVARTPFQSPYKVSPSTTTRRGLDFDNYGSRGSSTADAALGSSSSKKTLWGKNDTLPALIPASEATTNKLASSPKPKIPSVPGVQNLGNTCYLSASLQSLFSIPNFIAKLNDSYESRPPSKKMPLTESLLEVAAAIGVLTKEQVKSINPEVAQSKNLTVSSTMAANPAGVKRQMDVLTDKFKGYEQRDAHEFLSDLVDFLHDELAAAEAPLSSASASGAAGGSVTAASHAATLTDENKDPNEEKDGEKGGEGKDDSKSGASASTTTTPDDGVLPTDEYFRLNVRVCLKCDSCGYSRSKDELYRHLSVDVGEDTDLEKWTVERSLKQFFQPEKREIKCEKCDSGVTATQTMEIISCPKALLLHFKRFIVTQEVKSGPNSGDNAEGKENEGVAPPPPRMEMVLKKNKAKIPLEESLSINPFVSEKEESNPSGKYHLRSVVHHIGNTAFSGHYTTCAKRIVKQQQQQGNEKSDAATDTNTTTTTNEVAQRDNEEQWVFFDDRVGTKKSIDYVTGFERNQRNCYMALYEMN